MVRTYTSTNREMPSTVHPDGRKVWLSLKRPRHLSKASLSFDLILLCGGEPLAAQVKPECARKTSWLAASVGVLGKVDGPASKSSVGDALVLALSVAAKTVLRGEDGGFGNVVGVFGVVPVSGITVRMG